MAGVFYGVLESQFGTANGRGWLLQFDAQAQSGRRARQFRLDVSPSVIPASMVPSYAARRPACSRRSTTTTGRQARATAQPRLAVLDPKGFQADTITPGVQVMREVIDDPRPCMGRQLGQLAPGMVHQHDGGGSGAQVGHREQRGRHPVPLGLDDEYAAGRHPPHGRPLPCLHAHAGRRGRGQSTRSAMRRCFRYAPARRRRSSGFAAGCF